MRKLAVFNNISLDGYFVDSHGDMSWAHSGACDPQFDAFVAGNASGSSELIFGRVTYDLMAGYWPSETALRNNPIVAEAMNNRSKFVFSRSMVTAPWKNTRVINGDAPSEIRWMKQQPGANMVVLGSGSIVAQLASERLVDEYQIVLIPIVLGGGRTLFEGMANPLNLRLSETRSFSNGNVFLRYVPET